MWYGIGSGSAPWAQTYVEILICVFAIHMFFIVAGPPKNLVSRTQWGGIGEEYCSTAL